MNHVLLRVLHPSAKVIPANMYKSDSENNMQPANRPRLYDPVAEMLEAYKASTSHVW